VNNAIISESREKSLEKRREANRRYRERHGEKQRERHREYLRKWRQSPEGKLKNRESARKYRASPQGRYAKHKARAKERGIEWGFTFETWWAMWEPYIENIGVDSNQYQMCRHNDEGPYSPSNCRIDTAENNGREGVMTKMRRQGGESHD